MQDDENDESFEEDEDGEFDDEYFEEDEDYEFADEEEDVVVRENGIICKNWSESEEWYYDSLLDIVIDSEQLDFKNFDQPMRKYR